MHFPYNWKFLHISVLNLWTYGVDGVNSSFKVKESRPRPEVAVTPELPKAETYGMAAFGFKLGWKFGVGLKIVEEDWNFS